ncbi:DUF3043 domain-containing protein [Nocardioides pacificus]
MFRRSKTETHVVSTTTPDLVKRDGKGRPTPTRREAEAAARARAKTPRTRKEMAKAQRGSRAESSQKMRAAMKTGDERYLPPRDKGPVKRFIRDFVDTRFSFTELVLPLLLVTMFLGYSGNPRLAGIGNTMMFGVFAVVLIDVVWLRLRLRRELGRRFPEEPLKGTTYYALIRALQMRFLRLPKPQVKIGQELPEHYR